MPAVQALALSGVVWLLLFVIGNFAFWRNPHSAYFHSEHAYDLSYSAVRQQQARSFLQQYSNDDPDNSTSSSPVQVPQHAGSSPAICAAFVTVRREHPDAALYFSDSVGSMLEGLTPKERAAINVNVIFANAAGPERHKDYGASWLSVVDHAAGYEGLSDADIAELRRLEEVQDYQTKGVFDYVYALERCYNETRAPFIAVFEDDIVFAADWLARTLLGLQYLANMRPGWMYLRLFYSETYLGWDAEVDWFYAHIFVTLVLVSLTTAAALLLLRELLRSNSINAAGYQPVEPRSRIPPRLRLRLRFDLPTIAVLSIVVAPALTALVFMAGKYNLPFYSLRSSAVGNMFGSWQSNGGVVPLDRHACCSQALVFDRNQVPGLVANLRERGRGQTDLMIEEYCDAKPLRRFALGEQAVQHVATVSSRGGGGVSGHSVWAFYFEQSRKEEVEKRKQKALESIRWDMLALQAKGPI